MTQTEKYVERLQESLATRGSLRLISHIAAATVAKLDPQRAASTMHELLDDGTFKVTDLEDTLRAHLGLADV